MKPRILLFLLVSVLITPISQAATLPGPLIDTNWLKANQHKVVILDVRKDTKSFTGKPVFKKNRKTGKLTLAKVAGHIPGARLINYKNLRASKEVNGQKITRLLINKAAFEKIMQSAGVNKGDAIVIVSKGWSVADITQATRLYWSLKYYGQDDMAILNGGLTHWLIKGGAVANKISRSKKGNWIATAERKNILATSADITNAIKDKKTQLIDVRSVSQYLGTWKKSYVYAKGHIPGARNLPDELLGGPRGKANFTSADNMKKIASTLGIKTDGDTITYCNSGHLASGAWFMLHEVLGNKKVKMYDGSMHQWTREKGKTIDLKTE